MGSHPGADLGFGFMSEVELVFPALAGEYDSFDPDKLREFGLDPDEYEDDPGEVIQALIEREGLGDLLQWNYHGNLVYGGTGDGVFVTSTMMSCYAYDVQDVGPLTAPTPAESDALMHMAALLGVPAEDVGWKLTVTYG